MPQNHATWSYLSSSDLPIPFPLRENIFGRMARRRKTSLTKWHGAPKMPTTFFQWIFSLQIFNRVNWHFPDVFFHILIHFFLEKGLTLCFSLSLTNPVKLFPHNFQLFVVIHCVFMTRHFPLKRGWIFVFLSLATIIKLLEGIYNFLW